MAVAFLCVILVLAAPFLYYIYYSNYFILFYFFLPTFAAVAL